ncbi:peroxisome biogenesis factor 6 [Discoglossus pictus]
MAAELSPALCVRSRGPLIPQRPLLLCCPALDWTRGRGGPARRVIGVKREGGSLTQRGESKLGAHREEGAQGEGGLLGSRRKGQVLWAPAEVRARGPSLDWGQSSILPPVVSSFARIPGRIRLHVAPVDAESLVRNGRLHEAGGSVDRGAAVWVSKSQLREMGLYHREWVWVSLPQSLGAHQSSHKHLAMILAAELWWGHPHGHPLGIPSGSSSSLARGTGIISAALLFNLTPGTDTVSDVLIERFGDEPEDADGSGSALVVPPYATKLYIEIVKSPCYHSDGSYTQALCQHFQTPRAVQVGDVLCVSSLSHAESVQNGLTTSLRRPEIYYKVQKIDGRGEGEGPAYLADTTYTSLYQSGSGQSFVPSSPSCDGHVFWSSLSPAGLSHAVDDICRVLQPHLCGKNDVLGTGGRILFFGPHGSGKTTVVRAACSRLNLHLYQVECARLCRESSAASVTRLQAVFSSAQDCRPCVLLLRHVELLGRERDGSGEDSRVTSCLSSLLSGEGTQSRDLPLLIIATSSCPRDIPVDVQTCFLHEISLDPPSEEQRFSLLTALTSSVPLGRDVSITRLARRTAGFVLGDHCALLSDAGRNACARIRRSCSSLTESEEESLQAAGFPFISQDFEDALARLQDAHSQVVGAPKVPCVRWKDVGGLQDVKRQLLDTVQLPLEHPEVLSLGLRRSGVLLYGPPGTGKTMLAKAVATECSMTFLSVKGPELINMYVGQSEENVRDVFSRARAASPCIIFFDELDSLAPNRGKSGDSGGVMDRVVSQLLAELDGLHSTNDVFVIGATNRPDLLDSALLRPGRFDKLLYVGINEDRESQLRVLAAITRKFSLDPAVELSLVIERCPAAVTGADLYALCADAMMSAIKEKIQGLEAGQDQPTDLVVRMEHFIQASSRLQPSVSQTELQRYERIRKQYSAEQ